jgi:hypothetical protein
MNKSKLKAKITELQYQMEVMLHHANGGRVEFESKMDSKWIESRGRLVWDWATTNYRKKEAEKGGVFIPALVNSNGSKAKVPQDSTWLPDPAWEKIAQEHQATLEQAAARELTTPKIDFSTSLIQNGAWWDSTQYSIAKERVEQAAARELTTPKIDFSTSLTRDGAWSHSNQILKDSMTKERIEEIARATSHITPKIIPFTLDDADTFMRNPIKFKGDSKQNTWLFWIIVCDENGIKIDGGVGWIPYKDALQRCCLDNGTPFGKEEIS